MKVGFIGLGTMGASMAANLQKAGYELVVHDIRRAAAERHLAAGATWADSPKALAEQCEVIFTSLPGPPEVAAVALGPNGLLAGMKPDTAYFDLSTNSPTLVREINRSSPKRTSTCSTRRSAAGRRARRQVGSPSGSAATSRSSTATKRCSTQLATKPAISARSAPARSPSWCTIAPVMRSNLTREVFTMGVKAGVEPLALWEAVRQGAGGEGAPSRGWPITSCPTNTTRPISRCASRTRT